MPHRPDLITQLYIREATEGDTSAIPHIADAYPELRDFLAIVKTVLEESPYKDVEE